MSTEGHGAAPAASRPSRLSRPIKIALLVLASVGGLYLLRQHWTPVAGGWIYLLLLACLSMHLFHGHAGHGRHGGHAGPGPSVGEPPGKKG